MKIAGAANLVVRSFFVFIIAYLWTSYYLRGFVLAFLVATVITVAVNYAVTFFVNRRTQTKTMTKQRMEHIGEVTLQLKFMTKTQAIALLKAALCEKYNCVASTKKLIVQTDDKVLELFPFFHKGIVTESDIIECIKTKGQDSRVLIVAESFPPSVAMFVRSLKADIRLLDGISVYNQILAPREIFPKILVEMKKPSKLSLRELKDLAFSRARTKTYVVTAIVILISSLIVRFSIYYIIVATIVFGLALSSHFTPIGQNKNFFD